MIQSEKIKVSENKDLAGLVNQVLEKRVQGAYANVDVVNYLLHDLNKSGALVHSVDIPNDSGKPSPIEFYRVASKNQTFLDELNTFMKQNAREIEALQTKWKISAGSY